MRCNRSIFGGLVKVRGGEGRHGVLGLGVEESWLGGIGVDYVGVEAFDCRRVESWLGRRI